MALGRRPEPLRHLIQLEDVLLQTVQLAVGVLLRLKLHCDVAVDFPQIVLLLPGSASPHSSYAQFSPQLVKRLFCRDGLPGFIWV